MFDVCLPGGSELLLGQAKLSGVIDLECHVDRIQVVYGCGGILPAGQPIGFIDYQGGHFQSGTLDLKTHLWVNLDPVPPGGSK